eukprot:COSAG04_NODE_13744_length_593_cov_2.182186_1_plen_39_part_10
MPKSEVADRKKWGDASSSESKKLVRPAAPPLAPSPLALP